MKSRRLHEALVDRHRLDQAIDGVALIEAQLVDRLAGDRGGKPVAARKRDLGKTTGPVAGFDGGDRAP